MKNNKQILILLSVTFIITLVVVIFAIISFFSGSQKSPDETSPTPTIAPYTRNKDGIFNFTPLQRTTIDKTTDKEVEAKNQILSKTKLGDVTIYKITSATIGETDEVRTKNGVVIFLPTQSFSI